MRKLKSIKPMASIRPFSTLQMVSGTIAVTALTAGAFLTQRYRICNPNQYLVRTGLFINKEKISKKGIQWPFQTVNFIDVSPQNYSFALSAMSAEKMEFQLPAVFTIGPKEDEESLKRFATTMLMKTPAERQGVIMGIIEGQTRVLSTSLTIEQIFSGRKEFKESLMSIIQTELDDFGLLVHNANVKELEDSAGSEYFKFVRAKKQSEAENEAKVNVAEARMKGSVGEKTREATTRQEIALRETQTIEKENSLAENVARSNAQLAIAQAEAEQLKQMVKVRADYTVKTEEAERKKLWSEKLAETELAFKRSAELTSAGVEAEVKIKLAEANAATIRLKADADLYAVKQRVIGMTQLSDAVGGSDKLLSYLMLEGGAYEKLAHAYAEAVRGMQPKIAYWNTGSKDNNDWSDTLKTIVQTYPILASTIQEQTGITLPGIVIPKTTRSHTDDGSVKCSPSDPSSVKSPLIDRASIRRKSSQEPDK